MSYFTVLPMPTLSISDNKTEWYCSVGVRRDSAGGCVARRPRARSWRADSESGGSAPSAQHAAPRAGFASQFQPPGSARLRRFAHDRPDAARIVSLVCNDLGLRRAVMQSLRGGKRVFALLRTGRAPS
jgi:hypothetical protein